MGFGACIEEDGIDYSGHDIPGERKTTANSQECADFAASITGGLYWTFNKKSKMCNVKSSNSQRRTDADAVSGNRMCGSIGEHVSTIATKTGTGSVAGSNARVLAQICDAQGFCCHTSSDGRGLYNSERQEGQTDVYTDRAILGSCSQKGRLVGDPSTVKLTTSNPDGSDGWYVEWIRVKMSTGKVFSCPVDGGWTRIAPMCLVLGQSAAKEQEFGSSSMAM